ncbi:MAG: hypothetical protein ACFE0O_09250 [Opitutales bacterium]
MRSRRLTACFSVLLAGSLCAADPSAALDRSIRRLQDQLYLTTADGNLALQIGGGLDFEAYTFSETGSGWVFPDDAETNHRLSARWTGTLDAWVGERIYGFVKLRHDRGIHPGFAPDGDTRFDESFVRVTLDPEYLQLQAGKFAGDLGNFLGRHDSWENPFINYPLVYENVTHVSDINVFPDAATFADQRDQPDVKTEEIPLIWAPLYRTGFAALGHVGNWDYIISYTNSGVSSRSSEWNDWDLSDASWTARLGYSPSPAWSLGLNAGEGPYFREEAAARLPAGTGISDFEQTTYGIDLAWAWRHWEVFAEAYRVSWEVPNVGNVHAWSGYIEGRYQVTPRAYVAARINREQHERVRTAGGPERWDHPIWRLDLATGYRFSRFLQGQLTYALMRQDADFQNGEHLWAARLTLIY